MKELMSLISAGVADLPLRPLLYTAGAAVTAAGIYCYVKRGDGEKTPDPEDTPPSRDPVCDQATEPALVQPTDVPQDQVTDAATEAEEKIQKLVVSNTGLEDRVRELEELLCEARRDCDMKSKACEREQWAHGILQLKHDDMKELMKVSLAKAEEKHQKALESIAQVKAEKSDLTDQVETLQGTVQYMWKLLCKTQRKADDLTKECEREREVHSILQAENNEMKKTLVQKEELLKVSLTEAEEKHQKAVETIAQLEAEKSNLTYQVETLRGTVQESGNLISETHRQCDELTNEREREHEAHSILQAENNELKKTPMDKEEFLKVSLAEAEEKHQKAVETIAQLEAEKSDLTYQVETLRGTVQESGNLLSETHRECDELTNECEREWEAHSILQAENDEMKKTLVQKEEFLKVSLTEAEEKHQKAVETIAQLEAKISDLTHQVETLRGTVQDTRNLLSETHRQCDELNNECEREREAHSILQSEHNETKEKLKHCEELLMEREREWEVHSILQAENNEMKKILMYNEELWKEREQEREVHSILQAENDEMKETLLHSEEFLKVFLAEAEEKHQKAVETIAQLEAEKSDLTHQVETLRGTVQESGNLLSETHRQCDELMNECEREREVHSILQAENDEMKKTLIKKEELLKCQCVEKSDLTYQVETLRGTVQESGNLLSETHRQCDELTNECEREREAHSILQSEHNAMKEKLKHCEELLMEREREREVHSILQAENDEMKKTLIQKEELLKVSLVEAEEKHQKAVETIAQLEAKISDLTYQVETLQGTVQDMGNMLCETHRECDELTNEREREREAHSILQAENDEMKKTLIQKEELLKVSLAEAEEKHQKAVETIAQLEVEKSDLTHQVETLRGTVQESGNLLSETHRQCDELKNECEREREAHSILQSEHNAMKEKLKHCEELLMVSLAEAEEKQQKAVETIAQLEVEKSDLTHQVETLRGTVQESGNLLSETHRQCDELMDECEREREAHSILQSEHNAMKEKLKHCEELLMECEREREAHSILQAENNEMKTTLTHIEELLKVSLAEAEAKHQKAVETIAQLEAEKSDLTYQVETLRGTVQDMGNLLCDTHRECDELTSECEREREAHSILQAENDEMKKTLIQKEEFLKVSLVEAEEKHQKAVETIAQLEAKISDLTYQVETLRGTVQDMGNMLCETHRECDELTNECEREREAHSILQTENDEMKKTLVQKELLKVSLAEAEEKHQKAVETIAQLEVEKSNLTYEVETLRVTVQESGNLLSETHRQCDELTNECEREREAHSILQSEHNETKEKLKHCEELLMEREREREAHSILQAENSEMKTTLTHIEELLNVSLAEAEAKHQKAVETIAQLEAEKYDLTYQVETLRGTVQDMGNLLSETHRECDELTNEREREREVHSILQAQNDKMKKTLIQKEELLKVSLAEAEEKHQKAVETIAQLEVEKSDLTYEVETLRGTVQESGNLLSETHRQCDELTNECEREREAHSILQSEHNETKEKLKHCEELLMEREREREAHSILQAENNEMKTTLTHIEELLNVSLAEAEAKHQKAVETIAQLEAEKSDLTYQVETLRGTVQDMGNLLSETHRECDELTNEREREREVHSILQAENDEMKKTLFQKEEFLKVSLVEAEEKHQKAVGTIAQLEDKISDLTYQVETLRGTVQDMGNMLCETHRECDELTNECEREREAHSILQSEHNETKEKLKHCEELLMECERQQEAHSILNFRFDEMKETLMHNEKLLKECEREREAHHMLKLEYDEMKKTLTHSEELLKVSLAEAEEKYNKAAESIAMLEAEKSNLKYHMETVRDTMQDIRNVLSETHTECDELTNRHGLPLGSKETTSIERGSSVRRIGSKSKSL